MFFSYGNGTFLYAFELLAAMILIFFVIRDLNVGSFFFFYQFSIVPLN